MKRSTLIIFAIGLSLAILSSSTDAQDENARDEDGGDDDLNPVYVDGDDKIDDIGSEDYILLDVPDYDDTGDLNDGGDDQDAADGDSNDNTLDIRSVNSDDLLSLSDDVLTDDLEKRAWTYRCEQKECNARCLALLNLPQGTCGNKGKCYCKRQK